MKKLRYVALSVLVLVAVVPSREVRAESLFGSFSSKIGTFLHIDTFLIKIGAIKPPEDTTDQDSADSIELIQDTRNLTKGYPTQSLIRTIAEKNNPPKKAPTPTKKKSSKAKNTSPYQSALPDDNYFQEQIAPVLDTLGQGIDGDSIYYNTETHRYTALCSRDLHDGDEHWEGSFVATVSAGTITSSISVQDANNEAIDRSIALAKGGLSCTYYYQCSTDQTVTQSCPAGYTGGPVVVTEPPSSSNRSSISEDDACGIAHTKAQNRLPDAVTNSCHLAPPVVVPPASTVTPPVTTPPVSTPPVSTPPVSTPPVTTPPQQSPLPQNNSTSLSAPKSMMASIIDIFKSIRDIWK